MKSKNNHFDYHHYQHRGLPTARIIDCSNRKREYTIDATIIKGH